MTLRQETAFPSEETTVLTVGGGTAGADYGLFALSVVERQSICLCQWKESVREAEARFLHCPDTLVEVGRPYRSHVSYAGISGNDTGQSSKGRIALWTHSTGR